MVAKSINICMKSKRHCFRGSTSLERITTSTDYAVAQMRRLLNTKQYINDENKLKFWINRMLSMFHCLFTLLGHRKQHELPDASSTNGLQYNTIRSLRHESTKSYFLITTQTTVWLDCCTTYLLALNECSLMPVQRRLPT